MHHASARKLLENNFSILSLTFCVSNSDVQRVLMISRVFAITRFLQKRSNKPRLLMIPMCLMIAGLLSTSFLLLLALSKREGETNKDMWTIKVYISIYTSPFLSKSERGTQHSGRGNYDVWSREIHKIHNLFFRCQAKTTITFYDKMNIS